MTRLASLALLVLIPGSTTRAEEPKPIPTELEGTWREPLRSGEKSAEQFSVRFRGDQFTILLNGEVFEGTFQLEAREPRGIIVFSIAVKDISVIDRTKKHRASYQVGNGQLFLLIDPYPVSSRQPPDNHLGLASIVFQLEKLKK